MPVPRAFVIKTLKFFLVKPSGLIRSRYTMKNLFLNINKTLTNLAKIQTDKNFLRDFQRPLGHVLRGYLKSLSSESLNSWYVYRVDKKWPTHFRGNSKIRIFSEGLIKNENRKSTNKNIMSYLLVKIN